LIHGKDVRNRPTLQVCSNRLQRQGDEMPLPAAINLIPLHGQILAADSSGTPAAGTVTFEIEQALRDTTDHVILGPTTLTATLDATGSFTISLPATDDPDVTPQRWTYAVSVNTTAWVETFRIAVPVATVGTLELANVAPAVDPPALITYALASALSTETSRATAAETANATAITAETTRAQAAEATLTTSLGAKMAKSANLADVASVTAAAATLGFPDVSGMYGGVARLPRFSQPSAVLTTMQSGHGWTSNGTGTFNLNDTSLSIIGSQCATATTAGAGGQTNLRRFSSAVPDMTGKVPRLRIMLDSLTHLNEIVFYAGSGGLSSYYKWSIAVGGASQFITAGDWVPVTLSFADATTTGTPSKSSITDLQLQVFDDAGGTVAVHLQSVELVPDGSAYFPNSVCSICFDDSWDSPKTQGAWTDLDNRGWAGTFFTISDLLGQSGRLTLADLKTRCDPLLFGWESASHAWTDVDHALTYTGMTAAQLEADLRAQRAGLLAAGLRSADGTAYPLGQFGRSSDGVSTTDIARRYMSWARTTSNRTRETFPPASPYRLRAISSISSFSGGTSPTSLTTATTGTIDKVRNNPGTWLILVFHKISSGAPTDTLTCSIADFTSITSKIASAGLDVRPIGDVLRYHG
jgi:hypothetical protein